MPSDKTSRIQCQLFNYSLHGIEERACLYEALSYAWGDSEKLHTILIDGYDLRVTANLYKALLHLQDQLIERILWVDAICINQDIQKERAEQVRLMAKIYCKANRVIVWLGEAEADGHHALNAIRIAADEESIKPSNYQTNQQAVLNLLQRPWFQRIWVRA
jgi:hypothetical protein